MRRKPLPPPPDDVAAVRAARDALPLVPGPEDDCCARLQRRLDLPGRDVAGAWLSLLVALGLADAHDGGFTRVRPDGGGGDPADAALAAAFLDGVFGAREVRAALEAADGPLDAAGAAEATASVVPGWERAKHGPAWRDRWRDRTADLLGWLALLGLAERVDGGYRTLPTD